MKASDPQTDRELLLKLNGEIENLSKAINEFGRTLRDLEERRIGGLETRIEALETVWFKFQGGWKLAVVIWAIMTAGFGWLLKFLLK